MDRFLGIIGGFVFLGWFVNYDPDAHLHQKITASDAISVEAPKQKESNTSRPDKFDYIFPIKNKSLSDVISHFGDSRAGGKRRHQGIDIREKIGTPVLAVANGKILRVANKGLGGKQIWLQAGDKTFFYAHLNDWNVKKDQLVKQGEVIGSVGSTGNATTPHLHFEVHNESRKAINPVPFFTEQGLP